MTGPAGSVLLTSFEPFDGAESNPSVDVAEELLRRFTSGGPGNGESVSIDHRTLPVSFTRATTSVVAAIRELRPDVVHVPECATAADVGASADAVKILLRTTLAGTSEPEIGIGAVS